MTAEVTSEMRGAALIVTFNRPDHGNALTFDMANQLFNMLKPVTTDRGIRAVLIRGKGGNFMDGLDLAQVYGGDFNLGLERGNQLAQPFHSVIRELQTMEKPVLAAVDGHVAGPGLSFMLACDLVIAARSTKFHGRFMSYAMSPDGGASFFLARKVGMAKANQILMLDEVFSAEEAEKIGLVSTSVDDDKLQDEALRWIDRLASGPTRALGGVKRLVGTAYEQGIVAHLSLEHSYWGASSRSFDFREAIKALMAKREPKFSGA